MHQSMGLDLVDVVAYAILRLYHMTPYTEQEHLDMINNGLLLLSELMDTQEYRDRLLENEGSTPILLDMCSLSQEEPSDFVLQSIILRLCRVLAVDSPWRQVIASAGCLTVCCEIALQNVEDAALQGQAMVFIYLMCFEEENLERLLSCQALTLVLKVSHKD